MEKALDTSAANEVKFDKKPEQAHAENKYRAIWLVMTFVLIVFLVLGWVNFQTGRLFKAPESITYENALYRTEGEISTGEGLLRTGKKVDDLEIYVKKVVPAKLHSSAAQKIYIKAGEDYIVYVLSEKK